MTLRISKILSTSRKVETDEPNFWFEKSSYGKFIVDCRFGNDLLDSSVIQTVNIVVLDTNETDVTSSILLSSQIVSSLDSVQVLLQGGSMSASPYNIYCRVVTDNSEQSELVFQMRITRDSPALSGEGVTFGGDTVTFGGDTVTFGG